MEILFEFEMAERPTKRGSEKIILYRGIRDNDGFCRMEKKGLTAKRFKPYMWTGANLDVNEQLHVLTWDQTPRGPRRRKLIESTERGGAGQGEVI